MKRLTGILKERIILLFYRRTAACGLVQPFAAANAWSCSTNVRFESFLKDLRTNNKMAIFHPASAERRPLCVKKRQF